jgi:hypothetical protein
MGAVYFEFASGKTIKADVAVDGGVPPRINYLKLNP